MFAPSTSRNVRMTRPRLSVRALVKTIVEIDRRYRARVQLTELDDRMLRDMGLTRADVAEEVRRPLL